MKNFTVAGLIALSLKGSFLAHAFDVPTGREYEYVGGMYGMPRNGDGEDQINDTDVNLNEVYDTLSNIGHQVGDFFSSIWNKVPAMNTDSLKNNVGQDTSGTLDNFKQTVGDMFNSFWNRLTSMDSGSFGHLTGDAMRGTKDTLINLTEEEEVEDYDDDVSDTEEEDLPRFIRRPMSDVNTGIPFGGSADVSEKPLTEGDVSNMSETLQGDTVEDETDADESD